MRSAEICVTCFSLLPLRGDRPASPLPKALPWAEFSLRCWGDWAFYGGGATEMCGVPVCLIGGGTSLQTKMEVFRYKKRRSNCLVKNILYLCNRHYGNGDYLRCRYNEL